MAQIPNEGNIPLPTAVECSDYHRAFYGPDCLNNHVRWTPKGTSVQSPHVDSVYAYIQI